MATEGRLLDFWRECAPAGWRVEAVEGVPGRGRVTYRDERGCAHQLEWSPDIESPALLRGRRLAFGYRTLRERQPLPVESYRSALALAAKREDELATLRAPRSERATEGETVAVTESDLWTALALDRARMHSIDEAARRWVARALPRSVDKLLVYFESPCAQACEFCELPARRADVLFRAAQSLVQLRHRTPVDLVGSGAFEAVLRALGQRPSPPTIIVQGHDWLSHPRLDELLRALEGTHGLRVRVHGPHTRLADPALAGRIARLPGLESVTLTLQSSDPVVHDAIVGAEGAGTQVLRAIDNLRALGAPAHVVIVLTARTLPTLATTIAYVREHALRLSLHGFLPDRGHRAERAHAAPKAIATALASVDRDSLDAVDALLGAPLCAVPSALRDRVRPAFVAPTREPLVHPPACARCFERPRCAGVPSSSVEALGPDAVAPVRP